MFILYIVKAMFILFWGFWTLYKCQCFAGRGTDQCLFYANTVRACEWMENISFHGSGSTWTVGLEITIGMQ